MTVITIQGRASLPTLTLEQADAIRDAVGDSLAHIQEHRADGTTHTHTFEPLPDGRGVPAWTHTQPKPGGSPLIVTKVGTKAPRMFFGRCAACGAEFEAPQAALTVEDDREGGVAKEKCPQCTANVWLYPAKPRQQ